MGCSINNILEIVVKYCLPVPIEALSSILKICEQIFCFRDGLKRRYLFFGRIKYAILILRV